MVDRSWIEKGLSGDGTILEDDAAFGIALQVVSALRRFRTSTATPFQAFAFAIPSGYAADLRCVIVGKDRASGATYRCDHRVMYSRNGTAAPAIQGSLTSTAQALAALATATSTVDLATNSVEVVITPVNTVDTDWTIAIEIEQAGAP